LSYGHGLSRHKKICAVLVILTMSLRLKQQPQSCGKRIETINQENEMKQPTNEISAGLANADAHDLAAYLFDELPLSEQEASDIRAGFDLTSTPQPPKPCYGCAWATLTVNHNETLAEDEAGQGELEDLRLSAAQEADIKAGLDQHPMPCPCSRCKGYIANHNETVAEDVEDRDAALAPLADLTVSSEQSEEVKGGPYFQLGFQYIH
jgi:hypothetical protein